MASSDSPQPASTRSVRLIFEYEGDQVRLVSQQPVDMVVTGFDLARGPDPGVYVESRDAVGAPLARVPARSALVGSAEVFPEQPGEPIVRVDVPQPRGAFTVVVPVPDTTSQLTVVRVEPAQPQTLLPPGGATSPVQGDAQVTDLASFPLDVNP